MQRKCKGDKKSGERCKSWALADSEFCIAHDPERVIELADYRKRGGEGRSNVKRARKTFGGTKDLAIVQTTMMGVLEKLEDGKIDHQVATAMATVARAIDALAKTNTAVSFQQEIQEMRQQLAEMKEQATA